MTSSAFASPVDSLSVHDLTCVRGGRLVLSGLSLEVAAAEALVIRGPNGVGKSTLLRVLAGLVDIRTGTIRVTGDGIEADAPLSEYAHYIGHLDAVKPNFTVRENLQFWADYYGAAERDLAPALSAFALSDLADLPAQFLSAGQKKRTALARLLVAPRPIWLLDEPTVSLDTVTRHSLCRAIDNHLHARGLVVMTSHDDIVLQSMRELRLQPISRDMAPDMAYEDGVL